MKLAIGNQIPSSKYDRGDGQLKHQGRTHPFRVRQISVAKCCVSLKFTPFCINRQIKRFLIKLYLLSQSFCIKFGLFYHKMSILCFHPQFLLNSMTIYSPTPFIVDTICSPTPWMPLLHRSCQLAIKFHQIATS